MSEDKQETAVMGKRKTVGDVMSMIVVVIGNIAKRHIILAHIYTADGHETFFMTRTGIVDYIVQAVGRNGELAWSSFTYNGDVRAT